MTAPFLLNVLYGSNNPDIVIGCSRLVYFFGFTMFFYCLAGISVFAVQAIGCAKKSIPSFVLSAVLRVGLNYLLVSDYRYNLYGTVVSGAAGYFVIFVFNLYIFKKYSEVRIKLSDIFFKPLACSLVSFFAANAVLNSIFGDNGSVLNFVILSASYLILFTLSCILSKLVTFSEIKFMQTGKKSA